MDVSKSMLAVFFFFFCCCWCCCLRHVAFKWEFKHEFSTILIVKQTTKKEEEEKTQVLKKLKTVLIIKPLTWLAIHWFTTVIFFYYWRHKEQKGSADRYSRSKYKNPEEGAKYIDGDDNHRYPSFVSETVQAEEVTDDRIYGQFDCLILPFSFLISLNCSINISTIHQYWPMPGVHMLK